jgi:hypothetical protein
MNAALVLAAALSLAWCERAVPPPDPDPEPAPSPTLPAPSGFTCADACEHYRAMGCEEAQPTPAGASCVDVCASAQSSPAPLDLGCIVRAPTCELARRCE